jgi:hypothetical protein
LTDIFLSLGDNVGGDTDDVVVVVDLASVRGKAEIEGWRQSDVGQ